MVIRSSEGIIAQPPGWAAAMQAEARFVAAERDRILYVAATRARRELVISQCETAYATKAPAGDTSAWRPLATVLEEHSLPLPPEAMQASPPAGRRKAAVTATALREAVDRAHSRLQEAATPSFSVVTVTDSAKRASPEPPPSSLGFMNSDERPGAGVAWGRAAHRALEALGSGRRGEPLDAFLRALATELLLDGDQTTRLRQLVAEVQESNEWKELVATGPILVEMPLTQRTMVNGVEQIVEGIVDAAALGPDGWFVVDWKSDAVSEAEWERRRPKYERQVGLYTEMLSAMTGMPARGVVKRLGAA